MALPLLPIALSIAGKYLPDAIRFFTGDKKADAAEKIINMAQEITGVKDPAKIEAALSANPDLVMKLKSKVLEHDSEMEKLYMANTKDARKRDVTLKRMGYRNTRADIMILVVGIALCLDIYLIWNSQDMPAGVLAIFNMMVGSLLKMLGDAFQFEFGSSRGSKEKDLK